MKKRLNSFAFAPAKAPIHLSTGWQFGIRHGSLRLLVWLWSWASLSLAGTAIAGGGPQNVAVIVNPKDPDSLYVANAYVAGRDIPACNVIYVPWTPAVRSANSVDFREKLIKPVFRELDRRGIRPQIDFLAFSSGYPYMIDFRGELASDQITPQSTPVASPNGAMFLYQDSLSSPARINRLTSNGYFSPSSVDQSSSLAFSSQKNWEGGAATLPGRGQQFLASTVLGSTLGRGNSPQEIVDYLARAKSADGTSPKGTIYYMQNDNVRSQVRHETFPAAVRELAALGVKGEIVRGSAPIGKQDVAGLTTGTSHLRLRTSDSRIIPGALVDNLTSSAGQLIIPARIANPQTPVSEFMRLGAAGASGTVAEPYAIPAKFPAASLHVHYVRGLCLAEAFYRSTQGPYQLLILGDPICQPWAVAPKVDVQGIRDEGQISGTTTITPSATFPDHRVASKYQLFVDGKRHAEIAPGESFSLNAKGLADGFHRLRVVAIDDTPMEVQGFWAGNVLVKNGHDAMQLSTSTPRISLAETLELRVMSTAKDRPTVIMQNGRRLATIPSGQETASIKAAALGKGVVQLQAVQEVNGRAVLHARTLDIEVY